LMEQFFFGESDAKPPGWIEGSGGNG